MRVSRSKKTGRAKHYAFLEFAVPEVARIAAEAMDGYFMFAQKLSVRCLKRDEVHPELFKGANRKFKQVRARVRACGACIAAAGAWPPGASLRRACGAAHGREESARVLGPRPWQSSRVVHSPSHTNLFPTLPQIPWRKIEAERHNKPRTPQEHAKRVATLLRRDRKRQARIKEAGIDYEYDGLAAALPAKAKKIKFTD